MLGSETESSYPPSSPGSQAAEEAETETEPETREFIQLKITHEDTVYTRIIESDGTPLNRYKLLAEVSAALSAASTTTDQDNEDDEDTEMIEAGRNVLENFDLEFRDDEGDFMALDGIPWLNFLSSVKLISTDPVVARYSLRTVPKARANKRRKVTTSTTTLTKTTFAEASCQTELSAPPGKNLPLPPDIIPGQLVPQSNEYFIVRRRLQIPREIIMTIIRHFRDMTDPTQSDYKNMFNCILVSKEWFDVGISQLWRTVVLPSKAKAYELLTALRSPRGLSYKRCVAELIINFRGDLAIHPKRRRTDIGSTTLTSIMENLNQTEEEAGGEELPLHTLDIGRADMTTSTLRQIGRLQIANQIRRLSVAGLALDAAGYEVIFRCFPNLTAIDLSKPHERAQWLNDELMSVLNTTIAANLTEIDFSKCRSISMTGFVTFLKTATNLREFNCSSLTLSDPRLVQAMTENDSAAFRRLRVLRIDESSLTIPLMKAMMERTRFSLTELYMNKVRLATGDNAGVRPAEGSYALVATALKALTSDLTTMHSLEVLEMHLYGYETVARPEDLHAIAQAFQYFNALKALKCDEKLPRQALVYLCTNSGPTMRHLNLSCSIRSRGMRPVEGVDNEAPINDAVFGQCLEAMPELRSLIIPGAAISERAFWNISHKNLKIVDIRHCVREPRISKASLERLGRHCPKLKIVHIVGLNIPKFSLYDLRANFPWVKWEDSHWSH